MTLRVQMNILAIIVLTVTAVGPLSARAAVLDDHDGPSTGTACSWQSCGGTPCPETRVIKTRTCNLTIGGRTSTQYCCHS
ncbi:uncharacterized protein EDB93DRAFT_1111052 [Suillus bovinus]|uniref:uncharacterized protein n=1 Tax=Suillus bovinus TaxID=48563 RepID=UPI001B86D0A5|nr:uncharacterized protein EDB93DRAFT_1111052 [Suillus bovinus]KAG2159589.1 hypothetical protein EDB93DRAFT_1111052 [Suillus bovinus]